MKKLFTRLIKLTSSLTLLLTLALPSLPASAAGGSISLSANHSTVASGGTLIVAVYVNGGGNNVNAVQADISYPASKLQYVGFSASGSAFEIGASSGGGDGTATLARGTTGAVTGSGLVGTVTFRALVGSGSASIDVAGSSSLVVDGNPVGYGTSGTSVNFGAAAAGSSSGGSSKAAAPAAPAPPKDATPPVITAVKTKNVTPFSTTITWTTNEPGDSAVDYGLDANYGLSASAGDQTTTHSVALSSAFLTPQTLLHYRVKSTDGAGNVATGTDQTIQLPGVAVTIIVRGADGKPQAGATVTLDGATGTTDNNGSVTLPSGLGNKKVVTTYQGVTIQRPITVTKSAKPLPPYKLDLARKPVNHWMQVSLGLTVLVLTLLGIDAVLFGSRLLGRVTGRTFVPAAVHAPHLHAPGWLHNFPSRHKPSASTVAAPPPPTVDPPAVAELEPAAEISEPELDETKTIAELMELDPKASVAAPAESEAPTAAPIDEAPAPVPAISSEPVSMPEPEPLPVVPPEPRSIPIVHASEVASPPSVPNVLAEPSAPLLLTPTTEEPSPAASVAKRLKKPAHKAKAKTKTAKKKTTKTKSKTAASDDTADQPK